MMQKPAQVILFHFTNLATGALMRCPLKFDSTSSQCRRIDPPRRPQAVPGDSYGLSFTYSNIDHMTVVS